MSSSFFERGKGFLDKGKCLLGFHQGTWRYRRPSDCAQLTVVSTLHRRILAGGALLGRVGLPGQRGL